MKQLSLKQCVTIIRVAAVALVLVIFSLFLFSFSVERKLADDIWKQLGIGKSEAMNNIRESFYFSHLQYYGAKNFKKIATNDRAGVAKDLAQYTKQYIQSPEFKKAYDAYRLESKPREPELIPIRTKEQVQKDEIAKTEKMLKESEEAIKKMPADMQKAMKPTLDQGQKQLKEYQNPNHKLWPLLVQNDVRENEYKTERYKKELAAWEKDFPADWKQIVKTRLQKFLDITEGVDYNAELKERYNKKVFVNAEYERKPSEWKMAFRAGKEVTENTRAFVKQWLAELK